jgi:N-acetylglucosaminyldiphosphoundecaprenol N-acetyl-beta-D-mannosaminyltransferase
MRTVTILGVPIQAGTFEAAVERLVGAARRGDRVVAHFGTAHMLTEGADDARILAALRSDLVFPDGMPLVWTARARGVRTERICGPDMLPALAAATAGTGLGHFFYGGADGVPEALAERLTAQFPGLTVSGGYSPPFRKLTPEEDAEIVERINASGAAFVWVGLGMPKQELWVIDHQADLRAPVLLPVGAAFDFSAGTTPRAPRWMQRAGLEWLFRLLSEPRRLAKRYAITNTQFALALLREWAGRPRRRAQS